MKFDKELLLKHKFWLIAGGFLLLWLTGLGTLLFGAGDDIKKKEEEFKNADKALADYKSNPAKIVNTNTFLDPWNKYARRFKDHKDKIWHEAWEGQKSLISWPVSKTIQFSPQLDELWDKALSFADWKAKLTEEPYFTSVRTEFKETLYFQQFGKKDPRTHRPDPELEKLIQLYPKMARKFESMELAMLAAPAEFLNLSAGFQKIMMPASSAASSGGDRRGGPPNFGGGGGGNTDPGSKTLKFFFADDPTMEEIWLAQEDFWIKRELLHVIRRVIDQQSVFKEIKLEPNQVKQGFLKHRRFKNNTWEIDLLFEKNMGQNYVSRHGTIRNVDPSRRVLALANPFTRGGLEFLLRQKKPGLPDNQYTLEIKGEPLSWNQATEFNFAEAKPIDIVNPEQDFALEQVVDWSTSPIRRIDDIKIGAQSHRTAHVPLKPNPALHEVKPKAQPERAAANQMGGKRGGGDKTKGGPPPEVTSTSEPATKPNGLQRNRYLYVTEQCRHTPIGLVMIVEQEHIHDILVALTNSRLRFQATQVEFHQIGNVASQFPKPVIAGNPDQPDQPPAQEGQANPTTQGGEPDLVEVAIYGVAAIYDRFPIQPATPPKGGGKGPPADPSKGSPDKTKGSPSDKTKGDPPDKTKVPPQDKTKAAPQDKAKGPPQDKAKGPPPGPAKL